MALALSYEITHMMGWKCGEEKKPADASIFNLVFLVYIIGGTLLIGLTGVDPLQLMIISVVLARSMGCFQRRLNLRSWGNESNII